MGEETAPARSDGQGDEEFSPRPLYVCPASLGGGPCLVRDIDDLGETAHDSGLISANLLDALVNSPQE